MDLFIRGERYKRLTKSRETQILYAGEIATLESMIEEETIKPEFIKGTKRIIEKRRQLITYPDILEGLEDSNLSNDVSLRVIPSNI